MMNLYRDDTDTPRDKTWNWVTVGVCFVGVVLITLMIIESIGI